MDPLAFIHPVIMPVPDPQRLLKGRDKVAALSRLARLALMESCRKSDLRLETLPKSENGAPLPVEGVYWSLTHKTDAVGGVAALRPVGMDLETIRPVREALWAKVADRDEWRLIKGDPHRGFFRYWTAKEAVLKAVGRGMAGLSRCRVTSVIDESRMTLSYDGTCWPVAHFWFDNHVAALTSQHAEVAWTVRPSGRHP